MFLNSMRNTCCFSLKPGDNANLAIMPTTLIKGVFIMSEIRTVSNKAKREITLATPAILLAETLQDVVAIQGEDQCLSQVKAQLTVAYRSMIRTKLETTDDNDEIIYDDKAMTKMDFADWKPEPRTRKSGEEKALEALGALPPDVRAAVLANFEKG